MVFQQHALLAWKTALENVKESVRNAGLTLLYWRIGKRINDEILQGERAEYGRQIVVTLSRQLACREKGQV